MKHHKKLKHSSSGWHTRSLRQPPRDVSQWFTGFGLARAASFLAIFVGVGILIVLIVHAAGIALSVAPQSGALTGDSAVVSNSSALGGKAVMFGAGIAPTDFAVYTGGDNIALTWEWPNTAPASNLQNVQIWRNGTQIATVAPNANAPFQTGQLGTEYDDNSVSAGSSYQYKIRGVTTAGATSGFSPTITATQPTNSMPVPNITVNTSQAPTLASYMANDMVPMLKTWYPKVADKLAYPNYTPPTSYTITFQTGLASDGGGLCNTAASGSSATITCDPSFMAGCAAAGQSCAGALLHESTHVIQDTFPTDDWFTEGEADWSPYFFTHIGQRYWLPHQGISLGSYSPGAFFISYLATNYDSAFPGDLTVALHNKTTTDDNAFIQSKAGGKSVTQLWQEMMNQYNTASASIAGVGGLCMQPDNANAFNVGVKLGACTEKYALTFSSTAKTGWFEITDATANAVSGTPDEGYCLGVNSQLAAFAYYCNGQKWESWSFGAGNTIVNNNSGLCLSSQGGSSASGTPLLVSTCNGSSDQKWSVP